MATKFLRLKDVIEKTGLSGATIYRKMDPKDPGYDPYFPERISLCGRNVAWLESEIEEWMERMIEASRKGVA